MFNPTKKSVKRRIVAIGLAAILAIALSLSGLTISDRIGTSPSHTGTLEIGTSQKVVTIGNIAYAAGTADYTCDGTDDNVQFQAALNALPTLGGKLIVLAGDYSFSNVVSREIDDVTIQGVGKATYFARGEGNPIFSAGSQSNWVFRDFSTDAGGITVASATYWTMQNVWIDTTYYAYRTSNDIAASSWDIPSGRGATLVVASSNASAQSKAQADYVCDGTADNVEIQAAIDALPAGGGKVVLSEKLFNTTASIIAVSGLCLEGMGWNTEIKIGDVSTQAIINISSKSNVIISNLKLNGNKTAQSAPGLVHEGIDFTSSTDCIVEKVLIVDCASDGVDIDGGSNITVANSTIKGCRGTAVHISLLDPQHIRMLNVYSENNGHALSRPAFDIYSEGGVGGDYVSFESCTSKDDWGGFYIGAYDTSPTHNSVVNCKVLNPIARGISVLGTNNTIQGNIILNPGTYGIANTGDYNTYSGNYIYGETISFKSTGNYACIIGNEIRAIGTPYVGGLDVSGTRVSIVGNFIYSQANKSFWGIGLTNSEILGNTIDGGGRGLNLDSNSTGNIILGNHIQKGTWTIYIEAGSNNNQLRANTFQTGGAGVVSNSGTGNVFTQNIGYVTE
ncbi:MAG: right-handed parallel beta-helix repeat-containing protein, partial [Ignavibacteria bacterium]|nr:right-handed parallel beta-helix repeat-containing protein [Ignavibacteria bacterium]